MTREEYLNQLDILNEKFQKEKQHLIKECAMSNNPVSIGDVITDHIGSIRVTEINTNLGYSGYPECTYNGVQCKTNGETAKRQSHTTVYQMNIKFVNGKAVNKL